MSYLDPPRIDLKNNKKDIENQITQNGILNNTIKNAYPTDFLRDLNTEDWQKLIKDMNNIPDEWDNDKDFEPYILTAKEALLKSKEVHLRAIEDFILKAVEQGETSCEILPTQQYVSKENIDVLTQAGYTVINQQTKMGNEIKISWDERH